jgi:hypothetical protein
MRKVLSFVLVLALVLSSFSMAFAADTKAAVTSLTDIKGIANEDAIQVAFDLGIVTGNPDGTYLPEKAVTRAEFAAMLTRALDIPASALAGYTATSFKDTAGYSWAVPYLAFCQSKGILLGDGAGNVMPGKTITVNEAMTMALRAIGYTANSSLLVGAWPSNYVSIAQNESLYDDVATTTTVDKASAAQIIYNLLTVQKVAVNSDGTTDTLYTDSKKTEASNLLNTNLGCHQIDDAILGSTAGTKYADAIINITEDLGAYGTAYLNDDDELVAFTKDSTALTGKLNDDKDGFEVGDVTYDIDTAGDNTFVSSAAFFKNASVSKNAVGTKITENQIEAFALTNADDGETVTLNVDLSGKTIKDVYSVVGWIATDADLADKSVQDDISDKELGGVDFAQTDDDVIDMNSFELDGVASLDKIAENNVVYVYAENNDATKDIRKVSVGTTTVEGTVEEVDEDGNGGTLTIGGKDYDLAAVPTLAAVTISDFDTDSEGTFYLDINGDIYDFDGTNGAADTFAIVKAATGADSYDNMKIKLYKSDESTSTVYLSEEDPADIDWITKTAVNTVNPTYTTAKVVAGALVGYSLDANGDADTLDVSSFTYATGVDIQSTKVIKTPAATGQTATSRSIDADCVVFTYGASQTTTDSYNTAKLADVDKGTMASPTSIIVNDDGDVVALFIYEGYASTDNDDIYGVINTRTVVKNSDGDEVYKYKGFIGGTAFAYLADDKTGDVKEDAAGFGVYAFTTDASNVITKIARLNDTPADSTKGSENSGVIDHDVQITDLSSDKTVVTTTGGKYTIADDAVVYKYSKSDKEFTVAKLSNLKKEYTVSLYDGKGDDADGIATIVIYYEN